MAKMIKCKICGADIASNAKACPKCGAKNQKPPVALILLDVILVVIIVVMLSNVNNLPQKVSEASVSDTQQIATTSKPEKAENQPQQKNAYKIGETWTVEGQWSLTISGVAETDERNPYSERNPDAVYIVDYTYTNIGWEREYFDGIFFSLDETIVDSVGQMGYSYPGDKVYYAQETPIGATCLAQECIGVDNAGTFKIAVSKYDTEGNRQTAEFIVDVK